MQYLDLIFSVATIGLAVFAISALFALGLGVTLGRTAALADEAMLDAYLREKYGYSSADLDVTESKIDGREWIADLRAAS